MLNDLIDFLDASPSPWHAVASSVERLDGFVALDERDEWIDVPQRGFVVRDGAIIAWSIPDEARPSTGFRIGGAHTDSPGLRIKPKPDMDVVGWKQLGVEVYGGILNNTWLDRDLGVAGRIVTSAGEQVLVNVTEPVARVPQLAVHLDRGVNDTGLVLDRQLHLTPVWGVGVSTPGEFASWIGEKAGLDAAPAWWDLCLYDVQGAAVVGADASMLTSARLDNQLSCWAAVRALVDDAPTDHIAVIVLNDHEEVGSASSTGAQGPFLETVLRRLVDGRGGSHDDWHRALADSACVSADNAHAIHPNYLEKADPVNRPHINAGIAVKYNANQKYCTDGISAAMFKELCKEAGVSCQVYVNRSDVAGGSTLGNISNTQVALNTVDIGLPQLAMHSPYETAGVKDTCDFVKLAEVFYA